MADPIRTTAGKQLIEALDTMVAQVKAVDLDEASTFTRYATRARIDALNDAIAQVRSFLPLAESDAVQMAMPGIGYTEAKFLLGDGADAAQPDDDGRAAYEAEVAHQLELAHKEWPFGHPAVIAAGKGAHL